MKRIITLLILFFGFFSFSQEKSSDYLVWEDNYYYGFSFFENKEFKKALSYFEDAYTIAQKSLERDSLDYYSTISYLLDTYIELNELEKAEPLSKVQLEIAAIRYDKDSNGYDKALKKYAKLLIDLEDYQKALPYVNDIFIRELEFKVFDESSGYFFSMLIRIHLELANPKEALKVNELIESAISSYGLDINNDSSLLPFLILKGEVLYENEKYNEANSVLSIAVNGLKTQTSNSEDELIIKIKAFYFLGMTYNRLGKDLNAINAFEDALDFLKETPNKRLLEYKPILLNGIASSFDRLGLHDKALSNYEEAEVIVKKLYGENSENYLVLLNNMGVLYMSRLEYEKAYELLHKALEIKNLDQTSTKYNLAILNLKTGNTEDGFNYLKEIENSPNISQHNLIGIYNSLGTTFSKNNEFELANTYFKKAIKLTEDIKGKEYVKSDDLLNLGMTYVHLKKYKKAYSLFIEANNLKKMELTNFLQYGNERERWLYLNTNLHDFYYYKSLERFNEHFSDLSEMNLNNTLWLKGLLLEYRTSIIKNLKSLNDTTIDQKLNEYKDIKKQLSYQSTLPIFEQNRFSTETLKNKSNQLESFFQDYHKKFFNEKEEHKKSWKTIRNNLKANEAAIEFSQFSYTNFADESTVSPDSVMYVAYLIHNKWKRPKMIPLCKEKELIQLLKNNTVPDSIYKSRGASIKSSNTNVDSRNLYDLVWKPLEEHVIDLDNLYLSSDGLLHRISFSALIGSDKKLLCEKYNLFQLTSSYKIANIKEHKKLDSILLIGNINYEYKRENRDYSQIKPTKIKSLSEIINSINYKPWEDLKGAKKEVDSLESLFKSNNIEYRTLRKNNASEQNFKTINGKSPNIIHIATHGFFYENSYSGSINEKMDMSYKNQFESALDPLLRSGLILSGGNYTWEYGGNPFEAEDGILTAHEIANLDLSGTNLVILSACETGLGDVNGSEGIYGLQRAFKIAGVDMVMMSLWEVPDTETSEFMTIFYTNWLSGQKVRTAFRNTQLTMAETYKNEPEKWAAFVLFE